MGQLRHMVRVMIHRAVYFSGRVQGVGFRQTTHAIASRFDVTGFVRNLNDGRVELVVEGNRAEVDRFQQAIQSQMDRFIHNLEVSESPSTKGFTGFDISS